jgi:uncharacterized membrane protein YfcA
VGIGWIEALALVGVGALAGAVNVVAGGGSFLSLPLLVFLGLPPTVANGTNRIAILVQDATAVWRFGAHGLLDRSWILRAALPATAGAALGAWGATHVGEDAFRRVLAILMVAAVLWILWRPRLDRSVAIPAGSGGLARRAALAAAFFGVGAYGGFVQAGLGFLLLAVAARAGLDLVRGNALKVLVGLALTPISLAIFAGSGKVEWAAGGPLALGGLLGALIGVRLTVLKGHAWIRRVVIATVLLFALRLWLVP